MQAQKALQAGAANKDKFVVLKAAIGMDSKAVKRIIEASKKVAPGVSFIAFSEENPGAEGRLFCFAYVPDQQTADLKANEWVGAALAPLGGKGGGKADNAQGQAKEAKGVEEAIKVAQDFASKAVKAGAL